MFLKNEFSDRLVQVSLFSAIVYYITAYPVVFEKARKYFPIKFKKDHHQLLFHTFVFAVLMYLLTYFVFDPVVRVVEGGTGGTGGKTEEVLNAEDRLARIEAAAEGCAARVRAGANNQCCPRPGALFPPNEGTCERMTSLPRAEDACNALGHVCRWMP